MHFPVTFCRLALVPFFINWAGCLPENTQLPYPARATPPRPDEPAATVCVANRFAVELNREFRATPMYMKWPREWPILEPESGQRGKVDASDLSAPLSIFLTQNAPGWRNYSAVATRLRWKPLPGQTRLPSGDPKNNLCDRSIRPRRNARHWLVQNASVTVSQRRSKQRGIPGGGVVHERHTDEPSVWIDRPFLFLIRERKSRLIVFAGRVVNPDPGGKKKPKQFCFDFLPEYGYESERVSVTNLQIEGIDNNNDEIRPALRVLLRRASRRCQWQLRETPCNLEGTTTFRVSLSRRSRVREVTRIRSTLNHTPTESCVRSFLRHALVKWPTTGGTVTVTFRLWADD